MFMLWVSWIYSTLTGDRFEICPHSLIMKKYGIPGTLPNKIFLNWRVQFKIGVWSHT